MSKQTFVPSSSPVGGLPSPPHSLPGARLVLHLFRGGTHWAGVGVCVVGWCVCGVYVVVWCTELSAMNGTSVNGISVNEKLKSF